MQRRQEVSSALLLHNDEEPISDSSASVSTTSVASRPTQPSVIERRRFWSRRPEQLDLAQSYSPVYVVCFWIFENFSIIAFLYKCRRDCLVPCICFSDFYCHARRHFLKQRAVGYHTKKQCHTSHVTYPDPATTRFRPCSNNRVPGSGTRRNSLPVPPLLKTKVKWKLKVALKFGFKLGLNPRLFAKTKVNK